MSNPDLIGASEIEVSMPLIWAHRTPEQSREPICIVDDDEAVADSLKLLLETFGFDVKSYFSGAELLADDRRRNAGCLLVDQHMPGMNGLDVVERLQKEGVHIPTILISGRLDTCIRERAANLGVASVIEKPFEADHLVELIRTALLERD
jgi:two-component system, LuxR family, response regulator FixJ